MKLKLTLPVNGSISQFFGQNANSFYASGGLRGHTGIDVVSTYNDIIIDTVTGFNKKYVYSILNKDHPDLMKYRSVYQIVEADDGVFEISYGHCNKITCQLGTTTTGQPLATEGNTGDVFLGARKITAKEKEEGSTAGFHVHFQVRRLKKIRYTTLHSLETGTGDFIDPEGFHFDVPPYTNGYNGCIDPLQFIYPQNNFKFNRDLSYGSFGTDVYKLQSRLVALGFASFTPTGFFGAQTRLAVSQYQVENGISPAAGYVGSITRTSLNN